MELFILRVGLSLNMTGILLFDLILLCFIGYNAMHRNAEKITRTISLLVIFLNLSEVRDCGWFGSFAV